MEVQSLSDEGSYKVLYLLNILLIKHIDIQASKSADFVSDEDSLSKSEIKSTNYADIDGTSDLHSSSAAEINATKSAAECLVQSFQFGSTDIRLKKQHRKSTVISSPASQSVSKFKVFPYKYVNIISLFHSLDSWNA